MGMNDFHYFLTWFIYYAFTYFSIAILTSFILKMIFPQISYLFYFLNPFLLGLVLNLQAFTIQSFFSLPKTGIIVGIIIFTIQYGIFLIFNESDDPTF